MGISSSPPPLFALQDDHGTVCYPTMPNAPWTSETAPRNGGKRRDGKPRISPRKAREAGEQYLALHLAPFLVRLVKAAMKNPHGRAAALFLERAMPLLKDTESGKIVLQKITLELERDGVSVALPAVALPLPEGEAGESRALPLVPGVAVSSQPEAPREVELEREETSSGSSEQELSP